LLSNLLADVKIIRVKLPKFVAGAIDLRK